jgi:hypothetical protein
MVTGPLLAEASHLANDARTLHWISATSQWVRRHHCGHYAPTVAFHGVARQAIRYLSHASSVVEQRLPKRQGCAKSRLRLSSQPKHPGKHRNNHDHHDNSERQYPT